MTICCCVKTCGHTLENCKMKKFPTTPSTHMQWMFLLKKHDDMYEFKKSHRVCHCHFSEDQFVSTPIHARKPAKHAIPTLFPNSEGENSSELMQNALSSGEMQRDCGNFSGSLRSSESQPTNFPPILPAMATRAKQRRTETASTTNDKSFRMSTRRLRSVSSAAAQSNIAASTEKNPIGFLFPVTMNKSLSEFIPQASTSQGTPRPSQVSMPVNIVSGPPEIFNPSLLFASMSKGASGISKGVFPSNDVKDEFDEDQIMPPIKDLCRLCAEATSFAGNNLISIFGEEGQALSLANKIKFYLPIKVEENDKLPLQVCVSCIKTLDAFHALLLRCSQADITLQRLLLREEEVEESPIECPEDVCETSMVEGEEDVNFQHQPKAVSSNRGPRKRIIPCKIKNCKAELRSRTAIRNHYKDQHNKRCCFTCSLPFNTFQQLKKHQLEAHPDWNLCDICGAAVHGKAGLRLHMDKHVPASDRKYKCSFCSASYSRYTHLLRHTSRHAPSKPFSCPTCDKKFYNEIDLRLHRRIHADEASFMCTLCNATFKCKRYLVNHTKRHHDDQWVYECRFCQFNGSKTLTDIIGHINQLHEVDSSKPLTDYFTRTSAFCCNCCGSFFANAKRLQDHCQKFHGTCVTRMRKKVHELFSCERCDEVFLGERVYQCHMKRHGISFTNKKMDCDICSKSFLYKSTLIAHMIQHTGAKPFKCNYCEACFSNTTACREHERWHRGETPFQCHYCESKFISIKLRNRHHKTHTKPYLCKFCGKGFSKSTSCVVHERVHTGECPYKCKICLRGFKQKQEMEFHQLAHTKQKKFTCSACDFSDNKLKLVEEHVQTIHGHAAQILKYDFSA